jgi:hypothetical protein
VFRGGRHYRNLFVVCRQRDSDAQPYDPIRTKEPVTVTRRGVEQIPEAARWQVCSHLLAKMPLLYDIVYRPIVGESYDECEHAIWIEIGREARDLAEAFHLPRKTAGDLAETVATLVAALFGRDFQFEPLSKGDDIAVLRVRRCPFVEEADPLDIDHQLLSGRCLAFMIPLVELLNPDYTLRFVRAACSGDRVCEIRVLTKEEAKKED